MKNIFLVLATMLAFTTFLNLSGCNGDTNPTVEKPENLLKDQKAVLDKAKALEGEMNDAVEKRMEQVDP